MATTAQTLPDDELPSPPQGGEAPQIEVDGGFDAADMTAVPKLGEPLPVGTYHFRCESFDQAENDADPTKPDEARLGKQPYFQVRWTCQQEPYTGRVFIDFVSWVNQATFAAARSGDKAAQKIIASRLPAAKEIMEKAAFKPVGRSDFKAFLATNPELKIQLGVRERKSRNKANGQLISTGEMVNSRVKYLPLNRPV